MLTTTETRDLQVALSDGDLISRAATLVSLLREADDEKDQLADAVAAAKATIKAKLTEAKKLRRVIETGSEERAVLCEWYANPETLTMTLRRVDTGTLIQVRAMTAEERQGEMFAGKPNLSVVKGAVE